MKDYLTQNSKLKPDGIYSWGIPAYQSQDGFKTCPGAKACVTGCYARNGFYVMPSVKAAQEERLALARSGAFAAIINSEIKRRGITRVRVHDSGDFFSRAYLYDWFLIADGNPEVTFYAYTKMIPLFKKGRVRVPPNFKITFSYGGKWDDQINPFNDRHSRVFPSVKALKAAKYSDAHKRDLPALRGDWRIGLVYHGAKSKEWTS